MLMDILGIMISFAFVMLMLSLIVTVLVQIIQSFLKLRLRNLEQNLKSMLTSSKALDQDLVTKQDNIEKTILESAYFVPSDESKFTKYFAPSWSWIKFEDLVLQLKKLNIKVKDPELFKNDFERMENFTKKRFFQRIRAITVFCSIIVAFSIRLILWTCYETFLLILN